MCQCIKVLKRNLTVLLSRPRRKTLFGNQGWELLPYAFDHVEWYSLTDVISNRDKVADDVGKVRFSI